MDHTAAGKLSTFRSLAGVEPQTAPRPPRQQCADIVVSACRTLHPQDWTPCDYRLLRLSDYFEIQFHRSENAQRFRLLVCIRKMHDTVP
ncbi:MAG TPA: hypothetical protein VJ885_00395 [Thermoanaerobaculia bacterium]|nr:hypothetical protein [Thermoanaerobaculia bacterium]